MTRAEPADPFVTERLMINPGWCTFDAAPTGALRRIEVLFYRGGELFWRFEVGPANPHDPGTNYGGTICWRLAGKKLMINADPRASWTPEELTLLPFPIPLLILGHRMYVPCGPRT